MPLPDIQDLILTRLVECGGEIDPGVITVKKFEPPEILIDALPLLHFAVGEQTQSPISGKNSQTNVSISRNYLMRLIAKPMSFEEYSESLGSPHMQYTTPFVAKVQNYFLLHPLLESNATPTPLGAGGTGWTLVVWQTQMLDNGVNFLDDDFMGVQFTLNVTVQLVYQKNLIT